MPAVEAAVDVALFAATVAVAVVALALPLCEGTISPLARRRAKELFFSKLTDAERQRWTRERRLIVLGSSGRRYTIGPYETFNIRAGQQMYCLRVLGQMPAYDKLLAQRLLIESDEPRFLAVANRRELGF